VLAVAVVWRIRRVVVAAVDTQAAAVVVVAPMRAVEAVATQAVVVAVAMVVVADTTNAPAEIDQRDCRNRSAKAVTKRDNDVGKSPDSLESGLFFCPAVSVTTSC
jgi:hypothetical protein